AEDRARQSLTAIQPEQVPDLGDVINPRAAQRHAILRRAGEVLVPETRSHPLHVEYQRVQGGHPITEVRLVRFDSVVGASKATKQRPYIVAMFFQPVFIATHN